MRFSPLIAWLFAAAGFSTIRAALPDNPPNIVLITVDDMNCDTPGCFGGLPGTTPNIDRLAREGIRFERAHVTVAICQPSRQCLMTGRYPHNAGFRYFEPVGPDVPLLPAILHEQGYLNACFGKAEHLQPSEKYQWAESKNLVQIKGGRNPGVYYDLCRNFIQKAGEKPFFIMANSHDPHRPFHGSSEEPQLKQKMENTGGVFAEPSRAYTSDESPSLGFLPDTEEIKKQTAEYLSSSRRADDTVGEVLRAIRDSGKEDRTIVIFLSDNGMPFPFAKANCYLNSTKTPLIVRWPGITAAGSVDSSHFVNGIDLMPTILDILGLAIPQGTDGKSFLPLLKGESQSGRGETVTVFYLAYPVEGGSHPEKTVSYQMRAIHSGKFCYIYNAWSDGNVVFTPCGDLTKDLLANGFSDRVKMFQKRVPEEFYDTEADPDALHNLVDDHGPEAQQLLKDARSRLLKWMKETHDSDLEATYQNWLKTTGKS